MLQATTQQITRGALLARIDVALRQQAQPHQLGQVQGVALIVAVLDPSYCGIAVVLTRCMA